MPVRVNRRLRMRSLVVVVALSGIFGGGLLHSSPSGSGTSGTQWTRSISGTTQNVKDISCASAKDCYAVGAQGEVIATHKGGQSWNSVRWQLVGFSLSS